MTSQHVELSTPPPQARPTSVGIGSSPTRGRVLVDNGWIPIRATTTEHGDQTLNDFLCLEVNINQASRLIDNESNHQRQQNIFSVKMSENSSFNFPRWRLTVQNSNDSEFFGTSVWWFATIDWLDEYNYSVDLLIISALLRTWNVFKTFIVLLLPNVIITKPLHQIGSRAQKPRYGFPPIELIDRLQLWTPRQLIF